MKKTKYLPFLLVAYFPMAASTKIASHKKTFRQVVKKFKDAISKNPLTEPTEIREIKKLSRTRIEQYKKVNEAYNDVVQKNKYFNIFSKGESSSQEMKQFLAKTTTELEGLKSELIEYGHKVLKSFFTYFEKEAKNFSAEIDKYKTAENKEKQLKVLDNAEEKFKIVKEALSFCFHLFSAIYVRSEDKKILEGIVKDIGEKKESIDILNLPRLRNKTVFDLNIKKIKEAQKKEIEARKKEMRNEIKKQRGGSKQSNKKEKTIEEVDTAHKKCHDLFLKRTSTKDFIKKAKEALQDFKQKIKALNEYPDIKKESYESSLEYMSNMLDLIELGSIVDKFGKLELGFLAGKVKQDEFIPKAKSILETFEEKLQNSKISDPERKKYKSKFDEFSEYVSLSIIKDLKEKHEKIDKQRIEGNLDNELFAPQSESILQVYETELNKVTNSNVNHSDLSSYFDSSLQTLRDTRLKILQNFTLTYNILKKELKNEKITQKEFIAEADELIPKFKAEVEAIKKHIGLDSEYRLYLGVLKDISDRLAAVKAKMPNQGSDKKSNYYLEGSILLAILFLATIVFIYLKKKKASKKTSPKVVFPKDTPSDKVSDKTYKSPSIEDRQT
ncbi:MAG: hypothetical protein AAF335_00360 [Bacteroidota bacterium]